MFACSLSSLQEKKHVLYCDLKFYPVLYQDCMGKRLKFFLLTMSNEFRCYEVKIVESEKANSRWESNQGHLWLELLVLCKLATAAGRLPIPTTLTVLYMFCQPFHFPLFSLLNPVWTNMHGLTIWNEKTTQHGFFVMEKLFWLTHKGVQTAHTARSVTYIAIQYHLCSTYKGLWGLVVVLLSWLRSRALGFNFDSWQRGSTPGDCTFLYFRLITSEFIYFQAYIHISLAHLLYLFSIGTCSTL